MNQARFFFILLSTLSICFFLSCKPRGSVSHVAYIVGPSNDIFKVTPENRAGIDDQLLNSTLLITTRIDATKVKFCSGTLVDAESAGTNLRVLTNHHCFAKADADGNATSEILEAACVTTNIYIGFSPDLGGEVTQVGCQAGSLRTSPDMDLAVFTLARALPDRHHPLALWPEMPIAPDRAAMIIHYPDVEENLATLPGPGQKIQLPVTAATINDCKTGTNFPNNEWELDHTLQFGIKHTCDLIHGSSGSALIDVESHTILGVNWGGITIKLNDKDIVDNVATRSEFARMFLNNTKPTLEDINARGQSMDRIAISSGKREPAQGESKDDQGNDKKKALISCGLAGLEKIGNNNQNSVKSTYLLLVLFFAPIFAGFYRRNA